jgi:hypothetical protein
MFKSLRMRTVVLMTLVMLATLALFHPSPPGGFGHAPSAEGIGIIKGTETLSIASLTATEQPGFAVTASKAPTLGSTAETSSSRLWEVPSAMDMMTNYTTTPGAGFQATYPVHRLRGSDLSDFDTQTTLAPTHGLVAESKPGGRSPRSTVLISNTSST